VRHYINRDKHESEEQKKERIEFINYLQKLIKVKIEPNDEDILILKKELQNSKVMAGKWMTEKLNENQGAFEMIK
jgi:hypothetical protein